MGIFYVYITVYVFFIAYFIMFDFETHLILSTSLKVLANLYTDCDVDNK